MVRAFFRHILNNFQVAVRQPIARFVPFFTPVVTPSKPAAKNRFQTATLLAVFVAAVSVMSVAGVFSYTRGGAIAAANNNLNFQGRLLSSTGSVVPDGSYNIEFNLYTQQAPGGTTEWTEDYLVSATQGVTIKNGYFSVNLGSINPFPTTIAWDQQQYLGMKVQGTTSCTIDSTCSPLDAEMTPRFKLTAVPYAFRAAKLMDSTNTNAFTADDLIQKAPTLAQALNSANAAIRLNQSGAGGLLQLQNSGTDVFTVDNTGGTNINGAVLAKNTTDSTSAFEVKDSSNNSFLKIDTQGSIGTFGSNNGAAQTILQGGTNGVQITSGSDVTVGAVDANATLLVLDTKNTPGDPTGTNGAMYYNSNLNKFRCFENGAWVDCIGGGSYSGAFQSMVSGLQNVPSNATATPVETLVFTSSVAVSNTAGVTGFTAAANGSFRTCVVKNNAAITAGTLGVRWQVNGASVGSAACLMDSTNSRQQTEVLNPGVVTFNAGDTIGIAFDTSNTFLPSGSNDFTVYWTIEYSGSGGVSGSGSTMQDAYDNSTSASILTANNKDITFQLADTAIDSNFVVDIASGSTGKLSVQKSGIEKFSVNSDGAIVSNSGISLGMSSSTTAGTIRWSGTDFEGYDGSGWVSLTSGSGGGGMGQNSTTIVKPANETVNNSATLQDDDDLVFAIGANETWSYRYVVQANSNATADLKFAVTAPSGAVCRASYSDPEGATGGSQFDCGITMAAVPGNAAADLYEITGSVTNGATAGNVTLQWAQNAATAANTIVYAGSFVQATRTIGPGGNGQPFAQGGNNFGTTAVLGTSDSSDLSIITNNLPRLTALSTGNVGVGDSTPAALFTVGASDAFQINNTGDITTNGGLQVSGTTNLLGGLTLTAGQTLTVNGDALTDLTGTNLTNTSGTLSIVDNPSFSTSVTSPIFTGTAGVTLSSGGSSDLVLDSASNVLVLSDATLRRTAVGTTALQLNDTANTTFSISNTDATAVANLSVEGSVTANSFTGTGAVTLSSGGAGGLTLDSASNTLSIAGTDTTLQRIAAGTFTADLSDAGTTVLSLANSGGGIANLNLADGGLTTAGTSRLTNGGVLQNITGLTVASGGASITGTATFVSDVAINGNTTLGDATTDRLTVNAQILGANALVFQGATDDTFTTTFAITDPTANNTITIPNESGTLTLIGPAAAQVDSSTNSSLFINKTGATGNILTLQNGGSDVFAIANNGSTTIATTSTTALTIGNASSALDYFTVDTSGNIVRIGDSVADGVGTVLVLDTKNTAGDPTGGSAVNGAQYYNSALQQYRCFREFTWETCGTNPIDRAYSLNDEFMSGYTGGACTTATAIVGNQNWSCFVSGTATTAYNVGSVLPTADHPGIIRMTTGTTNGNGFTMALTGNNSGSVVIDDNNRVQATAAVGTTITNNRLRIGLHAETTTNIRPTSGIWWEADSTTNANWQYCFGTGAAATCASSGIAVVANQLVSLDIQMVSTGAGASSAIFRINNGGATSSFTVSGVTISTATRVNPAISCFNSTGAARECFIDYFQFSGIAGARR